jgi:hypothetical protein
MSVDYSEYVAIADDLIQEFGRPVVFKNATRPPANSSEPWNGPAAWDDATAPHGAVLRTVGVFIGIGMSLTQGQIAGASQEIMKGVLTQTGRDVVLIKGSVGEDLDKFDRMQDGATVWKVAKTVRIKPGDTTVLYAVELEQ